MSRPPPVAGCPALPGRARAGPAVTEEAYQPRAWVFACKGPGPCSLPEPGRPADRSRVVIRRGSVLNVRSRGVHVASVSFPCRFPAVSFKFDVVQVLKLPAAAGGLQVGFVCVSAAGEPVKITGSEYRISWAKSFMFPGCFRHVYLHLSDGRSRADINAQPKSRPPHPQSTRSKKQTTVRYEQGDSWSRVSFFLSKHHNKVDLSPRLCAAHFCTPHMTKKRG